MWWRECPFADSYSSLGPRRCGSTTSFFKGVVVHTKAEGFHILDHKNGGGTGVSLAEGMNLPNVRSEFRQVLHRRIYGQALIGELFFIGKIVIQRVFDTVPVRIDHGVAVQHPLFLGDVVLQNLSGVTEHAFKQSAVDGEPLGRRELEGFFAQQLCDSGRDNICFFGFVLYDDGQCAGCGRQCDYPVSAELPVNQRS